MKTLCLVLSLIYTVFLSAADKPASPKQEAARLPDGTWKPVGAILGGGRLPAPALNAITLEISGTNYQVTVQGENEPDRGTSILNTNSTPHQMTIVSTNGPNRGKTFLAIYEMKDPGSLRVCYDLSGTEFPKEFKAPQGTSLYLVGYRLQKNDADQSSNK
ncbi:MAG: TIGR03067 domain-containing protein [Limisphaerales bacterium]